MSPQVALLIFDLDGTLVDSKDDLVTSVNLALTTHGFPPFSDFQIAGKIGQGSEHLFRELLRPNKPNISNVPECPDVQDVQIKKLVQEFKLVYEKNLTVLTKIYPGVREMLNHFSSLPKVIVTNKSQFFADRLVDALELRPHFEAVFGFEAFPTQKPDPGPLVEVCRRWNWPPSHAVMIGDSIFDIAAGKKAGLITVGALYGLGAAEDLRRHRPDHEIAGARDLMALFRNQK